MRRHGLAIAVVGIAAAVYPSGAALEQCRATVSGVGGLCVLNPFYDGVPVDGPKPARRTKRKN